MRSLFPRIFVSFWIAMTLIGAAFAIIYASTFPTIHFERRRNFLFDAMRMQAETVSTHDPARAARELREFRERTDIAVALVDEHGRVLGAIDASPSVRALARSARRSGRQESVREDDRQLIAFPTRGGRYVGVGAVHRPSPWVVAVGAHTLPLRLLVVFLISGLVSLSLARYLTRPLRSLRRATQRIAEGDLSARVMPELGVRDREIAELGRDFDRMAARVEELIVAQQRLLSDVSHELNSPLARLRVALELARQRAGSAAAAPLDRIEREAERLSALIGEILTIARLEHADARAMAPVDLSELAGEIARDADFEAAGAGRRVVVRAEREAIVTADEELLRRAIENVVRNAVRFAPEGSDVIVTVGHEGDDVVVSVRDHGPGVPEEALREIFLPLFRVDGHRDRKTGGAGLGLAIADRAVKLHGGRIEAANARDGGLVVTLRVPRTRLTDT